MHSFLPVPPLAAWLSPAASAINGLVYRRWLAPRGLRFAALTTATFLANALAVRAQQPAPTVSPTPPLQVIQQQVVSAGDHHIIFNRVVPPPPRSASAPAASAFASSGASSGPGKPSPGNPSAGADSSSADTGATDPTVFFLSATVYDAGQFAELRGSDAAGGWHAWSNVDFLLLAGMGEIVTPTVTYSLYMALGTDTSDWLIQASQYPANLASLPAGQASYYFADGGTAAAHPAAATTLDAMHLYVDANRPVLLQARQQREAEQAAAAAQAEWARLHPTPPPDTVINFWPKQGSVFFGH